MLGLFQKLKRFYQGFLTKATEMLENALLDEKKPKKG
jgi:hypothetical protein